MAAKNILGVSPRRLHRLSDRAHTPWIGGHYEDSGFAHQKLAIVGFSHWFGEDDCDSENFTQIVLGRRLTGVYAAFFNNIANYFGVEAPEDLWQKVVFFNFLPTCIGAENQKYLEGTPEQVAVGAERFRAILFKYKVEKALVLSSKAWRCCPSTEIEERGGRCFPLGKCFGRFTQGTYSQEGHSVRAYGLRHAERAPKVTMTAAVRHILSL